MCQQEPAQAVSAPVRAEYVGPTPNHQLIFRKIKGYTAHQAQQMDALDAKAGLVAATATALTAGYLVLVNGGNQAEFDTLRLSSQHHALSMTGHTQHFLLYIAAFLGYAMVVYPTLRASRLVDWEVVPKPSTLVDEYWEHSAEVTLSDLVATLEKASVDNQPRIDAKRKWVGRAYFALAIQVSILAAASLVGARHNVI
jgi:hypothetical protein